jgi:hypothetical protein
MFFTPLHWDDELAFITLKHGLVLSSVEVINPLKPIIKYMYHLL